MTEKILCVDDDVNILAAFRRNLRKQFRLDTANSGPEGLEAITKNGPYAVVVSDMQMPRMNGIEFLVQVKERSPESIRIMLTGNADAATAVNAVNEGNIFRFLNKPCPPEDLARALEAGLELFRLRRAEKELLEKTVRGSIKVLTDILELSNPVAFNRASRAKGYVSLIVKGMGLPHPWRYEVAVMLSQIGFLLLPPATLEKLANGTEPGEEEVQMLRSCPAVGQRLISEIPRLEEVASMIAYQDKRYDGTGVPEDDLREDRIPIGGRILKAALDFASLESKGPSKKNALETLKRRTGWYDPKVVIALGKSILKVGDFVKRSVGMGELRVGMILDQDVSSSTGLLLVRKRQEVNGALLERFRNIHDSVGIPEPISVVVEARN